MVPVAVTGKSTLMDPDPVVASSSNPWLRGRLIRILPDDAESRHSLESSPWTIRPPLVVDACRPPRTPRSRTVPELEDTSTWPLPTCSTSMPPLEVLAVIAPVMPVPRIEPLPVVACNAPRTPSTMMDPDPVVARSVAPMSLSVSDPDPACDSTDPETASIRCDPEPVLAMTFEPAGSTIVKLIDTPLRQSSLVK